MALKLTALFCLAVLEIGFIEAFRADYTYVEFTRSYYKLHEKPAQWWSDAKFMCESEGAELFHPETEAELKEVERALPNDYSGFVIYSGISDTAGELGNYRTIDGRPVSQVFNKWYQGDPQSFTDNRHHCGLIRVDLKALFVRDCQWHARYICKADASHKISALERQLANKTAVLESFEQEMLATKLQAANQTLALEILNQELVATKLQASNQTSAFEILQQEVVATKLQAANQTAAFEDLKQDMIAMKLQVANQPSLLEQIVAAISNLSSTLERIAEAEANQAAALDRLTQAMQRQAANQTAAMEREALALEKFSSSIEDHAHNRRTH